MVKLFNFPEYFKTCLEGLQIFDLKEENSKGGAISSSLSSTGYFHTFCSLSFPV